MDLITKRRKEEELATWQRNLATLQSQAALYGMSPPLELVNEIETAGRNIRRIQQEMDAGQEQSTESTLTGILELVLLLTRRIDDQALRLSELSAQLSKISRRASPTLAAQISRWASVAIVFALYTTLVIKEFRDVILGNILPSLFIIVLSVALALLLRLLANLMQPEGEHEK